MTRPQSSGSQGELLTVVRRAIAASLSGGLPTVARAARAAGLSVRGLQRRLADKGITYSQLREEVLRETAFRMIQDRSRSVSDVAASLGYSDPAHFTRAFVRWSGMTPRHYRKKCFGRAGDPADLPRPH